MVEQTNTTTEDLGSFLAPTLADRSLRWLSKYFEERFDGEDWKDFEPESLLIELADATDDVIPLDTIKKVLLLKTLEDNPDRFYDDPLFIMHAVEIANGTSVTSVKTVPHITSLELAYAVNLIGEMYPHEPTDTLTKTCEFVLRDEGYTSAPSPFTFVDSNNLPKTESKADMQKKEKAIRVYLRLMELKDK